MKPVSISVMVVCSVMLWLIYAAASVGRKLEERKRWTQKLLDKLYKQLLYALASFVILNEESLWCYRSQHRPLQGAFSQWHTWCCVREPPLVLQGRSESRSNCSTSTTSRSLSVAPLLLSTAPLCLTAAHRLSTGWLSSFIWLMLDPTERDLKVA